MQIFRRPSARDVRRLLSAATLPLDDLTPEHLEHFFGCGAQDATLGVGGVELHGRDALLRSLAVDEQARGQGCGKALVAALEAHAHAEGARRIYLLTTTAARFFERLGYRGVTRDMAPDAIRAAPEFAALCPASAAFMVKDLG
ncbi:MAG TPA: arsenic resistance N-acetyltransferase ArsN2 [Burkholderiales bacterium]|nr:arsenic resistance N-acetyltransferase ArsN2 [Burkholderiales bacterium]